MAKALYGDKNAESVKDIKSQMSILQEKLDRLKISCGHQNANGKLRLKVDDRSGDAVCKDCGTKFNTFLIPEEKVQEAVYVMHNLLNQLIVYGDPKKEGEWIKLLGQMDANVLKLAKKYGEIVLQLGKKKKKKKGNKKANRKALHQYMGDFMA